MSRALVASCLLGLAIAGCGLLIGSDPEGSRGSSGGPLAEGGSSDGGPGGPVIACKTPADCPAASSACVLPACTDDGRCAEIATGSSAPLPPAYQQEAGFCIEQYCDRGKVRTRDKPSCGMGGTCKAGACTVPASCTGAEGAGNDCGSTLESCCASIEVPGGTYKRRYDAVAFNNPAFPATVSTFRLDKFEVTAGRLQAFYEAGAGKVKAPVPGQGAHPKIPGSGWLAAWGPLLTYTGPWNADKRFPAKANWYVAFAFCVFDGGRLPTEAEWGYAASGGEEQRVFPWSVPASDLTFIPAQAITGTVARVGVATGAARWGHFDLAGNAQEWVLDQNNDLSSIRTCTDCAFVNPSDGNSLWKSGGGPDLGGGSGDLRIAGTGSKPRGDDRIGFRCARDM